MHFTQSWNSSVNPNDLPDVIASISTNAINDFLSVHRNKQEDKKLYRRVEKLLDRSGVALFSADVILGGNKTAHNNGTAKPLRIKLGESIATQNSYEESQVKDADALKVGYQYDYAVAEAGTQNAGIANAIFYADDVNFYFSWPASDGGPAWETHLPNISFQMEAAIRQIEKVDQNGKKYQAVEFEPQRLIVSKGSTLAIEGHLARVSSEKKIQDLFFALLNYISLSIGPKLTQAIVIPVLKIDEMEVLPSLLSVRSEALTFGAKINSSSKSDLVTREVQSFEENYWKEVKADLLSQESNIRSKKYQEIKFSRSEQFLLAYRDRINLSRQQLSFPENSDVGILAADANSKIGVGLSEYILNRLVARFGNIHQGSFTQWADIKVIRGRIGYELSVGNVAIAVSNAGITGGAPIDAFAGLFYQLITIKDCKTEWGDEKKLGLGVRGTPKITLKTKMSSGLSILADFDLGGLAFYTGAGFPFDDILKILSKPLMAGIETILDIIAYGISFQVLPVKFELMGHATVINLSQFTTSLYQHPNGGASSKNKFAAFVAQSAAG